MFDVHIQRLLRSLDERLYDGRREERARAVARALRALGAPLSPPRLLRLLRREVTEAAWSWPRATAVVLALEKKSASDLLHLARHFPSEKWCAEILGDALGHRLPLFRRIARTTLNEANFSANPIRDRLIASLSDSRREVRRDAAQLLQSNCCAVLPPDLALHQRLLQDDVPKVRSFALRSLGEVLKQAIAPITGALGDAHSEVRGSAAVAMSDLGEATGNAFPALTKLLGKSKYERRCAATALREPVLARPETVGALVRAVGSSDWWASRCAAQALFGANRALDSHRSILLRLTRHPLPFVRSHAVGLLRLLVYDREKTVPLLDRALDDSDGDVRWAAVRTLEWIRSSAQVLRERLEKRRKRADFEKKVTYSLALEELGVPPSDLVTLLIRGITVPAIRLNCITALRLLGTRARAAIPALRRALKNRDANVSTYARSALESIERR